MKKYVVMHDHGAYEGWKVVIECDSLLEAVQAREADLRNGGGVAEIFEHIPPLVAYRVAGQSFTAASNHAQSQF